MGYDHEERMPGIEADNTIRINNNQADNTIRVNDASAKNEMGSCKQCIEEYDN